MGNHSYMPQVFASADFSSVCVNRSIHSGFIKTFKNSKSQIQFNPYPDSNQITVK